MWAKSNFSFFFVFGIDLKNYERLTQQDIGDAMWSVRILPSQESTHKIEISDAWLDLSSSTFCEP